MKENTYERCRGQVVIIAVLLMLLMLISTVAVINFIQVPIDEEKKEFDHLQLVKEDLKEVDTALTSAGYQGTSKNIMIQLGTDYEGGFVLDTPFPKMNSLDPVGTIKVKEMNESYILESESGNDLEFGTHINNMKPQDPIFRTEFKTSKITYSTEYNHLANIETHFEGYVNYNNVQNQQVLNNGLEIVKGNRIKILLISGALDKESNEATTLNVKPISTSSSPITVENLDSIKIPTNLDSTHDAWTQLENREKNVNSVSEIDGEEAVRIDLDNSVTYRLDISKVQVTGDDLSLPISQPSIQYIQINPPNVSWEANKGKEVHVVATAYDEYHNRASSTTGWFQPYLTHRAGRWEPDRESTTNLRGTTSATWVLENNTVGEQGEHEFNWGLTPDG